MDAHLLGSGVEELDPGQLLVFSGSEKIRQRGLAASAMLGYNLISDRVMTVRLEAKPVKEEFYALLQETLNSSPKGDLVMIAGEVFERAGCIAMLEQQVQRRKLQYFGHIVRQHESVEKSVIWSPQTRRSKTSIYVSMTSTIGYPS